MKEFRSARPFSIRFTDSEKAMLLHKAGNMPLGAYLRHVALGSNSAARRTPGRPVRDGAALGQVLALLGQSRLSNNLNQLAKSANFGNLAVTEETEADLIEACAAVAQMRALLLAALGMKSFDDEAPVDLSATFTERAGTELP